MATDTIHHAAAGTEAPKTASTLIVSLVYGGLRIEDTPFVSSLQRVGYEGDVHVMSTDLDVGNRKRMFFYRKALLEAPDEIDTVILTDVRDVVFQRNPEHIPHGELDVYLEDGRETLGSCRVNRQTFVDEYGEAELARVADRPVSCAGVVIGTRSGALRYLDRFCEEVLARRPDVRWSQPLHNWLLWNGELDPVNVIENERAPVYTVGNCSELRVRHHQILNRAGEVPFMVHQFDRHLQAL